MADEEVPWWDGEVHVTNHKVPGWDDEVPWQNDEVPWSDGFKMMY